MRTTCSAPSAATKREALLADRRQVRAARDQGDLFARPERVSRQSSPRWRRRLRCRSSLFFLFCTERTSNPPQAPRVAGPLSMKRLSAAPASAGFPHPSLAASARTQPSAVDNSSATCLTERANLPAHISKKKNGATVYETRCKV